MAGEVSVGYLGIMDFSHTVLNESDETDESSILAYLFFGTYSIGIY